MTVAALICAHEVSMVETSTLTQSQLPAGGPRPVPVPLRVASKSSVATP
jgi:hypothetical protein